MRVGGRILEAGAAPYVIAELGVNHDGDTTQALRLVEAAADAGADAVKLQWFEAVELLSGAASLARYQRQAGAEDPESLLSGLELDATALSQIVELTHARGLQAMVTIFSVRHVPTACTLPFEAFKIASPDIVHRPLITALRATGRPILVSSGAATLKEVADAAEWLDGHPHCFLHCVSAYPVPEESAALAGRRAMEAVTGAAVGYSDHTTAEDTGALAVAAGACVLEKHLTLDSTAAGPDHATSLEPDAFARYVKAAQRAWIMLGPAVKSVQPLEQEVRRVSRQSVTTTEALRAGTILESKHLTVKRPGLGLSPARLSELPGRRLARPIAADTPLTEDDLS